MGGNGRIHVQPDPAKEGQEVAVTAPGASEVFVSESGTNKVFKVTLDSNGKGKFKVPKGTKRPLIITDDKWPKSAAYELQIVSSFGGGSHA